MEELPKKALAGNRQILAAIFLPLLLTILPLWFLNREASREKQRAIVEADEVWFEQTDIAARRMSEASSLGFWLSRKFEHFRKSLEKDFKAGAASRSLEAEALEKLGWKLWGCTTAELTGNNNGRAKAIALPGFVTAGRALMTQTLSEILNAQTFSGEKLGQEPMSSRLRAQFGIAVSGIHFQPRMRGRPFAVIMDDRAGYAVWDLLQKDEKSIGIVLGFLPVTESDMRSGPAKTLAAWNSPHLEPVYFHLPNGNVFPEPLYRESFAPDSEARDLLARIQSTIGIEKGPQPDGDLLGVTSLPINLLDRPLRSGNWRCRLIALDPVCGYLGMLCQRVSVQPALPMARLQFIAGWASFAVWLVIAMIILCGRKIPTPGVRFGLTLWLAGVVAVPLLLGFNAAGNMLLDREKTLIDGLKRNIKESLASIDRESVRLLDTQESACREILGRSDLTAGLRRCQLEQQPPDSIFKDIYRETRAHGIDLRAVLLFGFNGYFRYQVFDGWSRKADQMMVGMLESMWKHKIASETPPIPLTGFPPAANAAGGGSVFTSGLSANSTLGMTFDRVEEKLMGLVPFSLFHTRLKLDNKTWFIACLAWTQRLAYSDYLARRIAREASRPGAPEMVAVKHDPEAPATIPVTARADLVDFANEARSGRLQKKAFIGRDQYLYVGFPCIRMPGYILAARMPLAGVESEIADERRTLHLLIGAGLTLVLLIAWLLSNWLAVPIVRISRGLSRIASGDLNVIVGEDREDELGQAGASLDAMTGALRERRQLSRFVPPQVLEIAAAGDPDLAVSGRKQFVTILSLDIRNFTSLSEHYSPERIFKMLNCHLEAMTEVIQQEGGIIDRFIGDAIVAVFPPGLETAATHEARAVRAAQQMMLTHAALIAERSAAGEFVYAIGIGIENGEVITGVLGDPEVQLDFSVLGEAVSRANDLEALSKKGRAARIIVSDSVRCRAGKEFSWLSLSGQPGVFELDIPGFIFPGNPATEEPAPDAAAGDTCGNTIDTRTAPASGNEAKLAQAEAFSPDQKALQASDTKNKVFLKAGAAYRVGPSLSLVLAGLFIWLLPFVMVRQSWNDLARSRHEARQTKTLLQLQDDLHFVQQNLDPAMIASLELRHRMQTAAIRTLRRVISASSTVGLTERERLFRSLLPEEIRAALESVKLLFPGLFWLHDVSQPPPGFAFDDSITDASLAGIASLAADPELLRQSVFYEPGQSQVVERGGPVPSVVSDEDCWLAGASWRYQFIKRVTGLASCSPSIEAWAARRQLLPDIINLEQTIGNFGRQLFLTTFAGQLRHVYIHPFFKNDLRRTDESLDRSVSNGLRHYQGASQFRTAGSIRQNLLGMLWLAIDPEELTLERTIPLLAAEMRRRGAELSVDANPGPARPFVSLPPSNGQLRLAGTAYSGNTPLFITLSRDLRGLPGGERSGYSEISAWFVALIWILMGIAIGGRWLMTGTLPAPALRLRLRIAFFVVSMPFLLCSWLILERAAEEAQIRTTFDARDRLLRDLSLADSGRKVFDGTLIALTDAILVRSGLPEDLARDVPTVFSSRKSLLADFYACFIKNGFRLVSLDLLDLVSTERYPFVSESAPETTASKFNDTFTRKIIKYLFRQTFGRMLKDISPRKKSEMKSFASTETVIGVEFEDFSQGMAMMVGAERMSYLTLAEKSIGIWAFTSEAKEYRLRQVIWHKSLPVGALQVQWDNLQSEPRQFASLFNRYPDLNPDAPLIFPCQKSSLMWANIPPMSKVFAAGESELTIYPLYWKSPDWFELASLAAHRKEPVIAEKGTGVNTVLLAAFPGRDFSDWVFVGEAHLGRAWKSLAEELDTRRLVLLFTLLMVLLLTHRVASRFLEPVAKLVDAANRIRHGDYGVSLDFERTDEFAVLAGAFNRMAVSAKEGRLLGRFVPATARALAADDQLSRAARAGESRQVIVLFAGLAGFKKLLATNQPAPLIIWLNRHLETMSRIIRAHGGETNKFIGDKILAVFTPAPGQHLESVMPAAIETARKMRRAFPELQTAVADTGPGPEPQLGIGMVAGQVLAGILGTESVRLEFTVIGDTVNLASRLSDLAASQDGGGILVERDLVGAIVADTNQPARFKKIATSSVKGKSRAIEIFSLLE
ncbi:MAG: adenylate/guanylate cyclase domain-containing protein [Candidatus Riflebacteria bacterium]|nr:adenylate/guanylate cyclase domain-containing protein [Candidatus Riflebacteria bacterium]